MAALKDVINVWTKIIFNSFYKTNKLKYNFVNFFVCSLLWYWRVLCFVVVVVARNCYFLARTELDPSSPVAIGVALP
jgi:hypothetical protein